MNENNDNSTGLIEIINTIVSGTQMSHVLNYTISNETVSHIKSIREILNSKIENITHAYNIAFQTRMYNVPMTWRTSSPRSVSTCPYYYCAPHAFSDQVVHLHTRELIAQMTNEIYQQHPEFGREWYVNFLVTKTLCTGDLKSLKITP